MNFRCVRCGDLGELAEIAPGGSMESKIWRFPLENIRFQVCVVLGYWRDRWNARTQAFPTSSNHRDPIIIIIIIILVRLAKAPVQGQLTNPCQFTNPCHWRRCLVHPGQSTKQTQVLYYWRLIHFVTCLCLLLMWFMIRACAVLLSTRGQAR